LNVESRGGRGDERHGKVVSGGLGGGEKERAEDGGKRARKMAGRTRQYGELEERWFGRERERPIRKDLVERG